MNLNILFPIPYFLTKGNNFSIFYYLAFHCSPKGTLEIKLFCFLWWCFLFSISSIKMYKKNVTTLFLISRTFIFIWLCGRSYASFQNFAQEKDALATFLQVKKYFGTFKIFKGVLLIQIAAGLLGFACHVLDNQQDFKLHDTSKLRYLDHFPIVQVWDSSYYFSMIISSRSHDERHNNHLNIGLYCHLEHHRAPEAPV